MTKSKRREPRDRLSELPDSLIFHILWFLPMTDVVKTSLLSRRWRSLWTTTPYLNFSFSHDSYRIYRGRFTSQALLSWTGMKILKFNIEFMYPYAELFGSDLWVRFAVEKKVEELYLHGHEFLEYHCKDLYKVPQCLYSCSSLKVLSLIGCHVHIDGNVQWTQLKSLTIGGKSFSNCEPVLDQVLYGAPQLEVLNLDLMDIDANVNIRSSSLRKLSIDKYCCFIRPPICGELRIWTPKLERLEISGDPYTKCLLSNVSSLTHATLHFNDETHEVLYDDFLGETLRQIFPSIQHVEMVSFSNWCIKVLARVTKEHMISPLSNVNFLKIRVNDKEVVEIFRKMKMLVLVDEDNVEFDGKNCREFFPEIFPKLQLLRLHVSVNTEKTETDTDSDES